MESALRGYDNLDADAKPTEGDESDSGSDTDSEPDSEAGMGSDGDAPNDSIKLLPTKPLVSDAYTEFLQFLELGCSGSPVEGYPLVLVVLAGIPSSVQFILHVLNLA